MRTKEYPLDISTKERLKKLKIENKQKVNDIAYRTGLSTSKIKNILLKDGTQSIDEDTLRRLSEVFNCTSDYILGLSPNPQKDKDNRTINHPVRFQDRDYKLEKVSDYLQSNFTTLDNLYFLFFTLPTTYSSNIINGLNNIIDATKNNSLWALQKTIGDKDYRVLTQNLNYLNPNYCHYMAELARCGKDISDGKYKKAILSLLEIIDYATTKDMMCKPLAKEAHKRLLSIPKETASFDNFIDSIEEYLIIFENHNYLNISKECYDEFKSLVRKFKMQ